MPALLLAAIKPLLFGWMKKIATKEFIEWVIWSAAEEYVKSTKTQADDQKLAELRKFLD